MKVHPLPAAKATRRPARGAARVTVVLPWDLDPALAAYPRSPEHGQLLVLETKAKPRALPFHRQKLALVLSAVRHFVQERRAAGFHVEHRWGDDYASAVRQFFAWARPEQLHLTAPREYALDARFRALARQLPLTLHDDGGPQGHFLLSRAEAARWAASQRTLRMDRFYPFMRRRLRLLLDAGGRPLGGKWSFDVENRGHARGVKAPQVPWHRPDALTRQALGWAQRAGRWGDTATFGWPVTRAQARAWLRHFVARRLALFGRYEDSIRSDARFLFHSLLSPALNLGLLSPLEMARAAQQAFEKGRVPLPATEGFIRQVIGWREFMRVCYWRLMPGLRRANQLRARRPLPDFFWAPQRTAMQCVREAVQSVQAHGYTHHIERLMVLCNYATLAGLQPRAVSHWFWAAFVDAYEWVELPNVVGMGTFGTGAFTTKPYVATAAYLKRQSGLGAVGRGPLSVRHEAPCARCRYDPDRRTGPDACPFNALYWSFLARHRTRLASNVRVARLYGTLDRFAPGHLAELEATAAAHLKGLEPHRPPWRFDEDAG